MRYLFLILLAFGQANAETIAAADEKQIALNIHDVYFKEPLLAWENITFVVNGMLPNSCYTFHSMEVKHPDAFRHEVFVYANVKHAVCASYLSPFSEEGSLGQLQPGRHLVMFLASDGTGFEKSILVQ
jgi:hypothetical protein